MSHINLVTNKRQAIFSSLGISLLFALLIVRVVSAAALPLELVSRSSAGVIGDGDSGYWAPDISGDGRYVIFNSRATNFAPNDTNASSDVFVKDRQTGIIRMVSTTAAGVQGNSHSGEYSGVAISNDGRYVAFDTGSSNLGCVTGGIIHKDLQTGVTTCATTDVGGVERGSSGDFFALSGDGRYVSYESGSNLYVAGDTNGVSDIFRKDTQTGAVLRMSVSTAGVQGNGSSDFKTALSYDGRYVIFASAATNLVAGDTNASGDVFVRDVQLGTTTRVSTTTGGAEANSDSYNPRISDDGKVAVFISYATNLAVNDTNVDSDVIVKNIVTGVTSDASTDINGVVANGYSEEPSISGDGRYVSFVSRGSNLIPNDTNTFTDNFLKDVQTGEIIRVNENSDGVPGGYSYYSALSSDGKYFAMYSGSTGYVADDTNAFYDVFVKTLTTQADTAPSLASQSLTIGSDTLAATTDYTITFSLPTVTPVQAMRLQFCTTAAGACTAPSGFSASSFSLASQTFSEPTAFIPATSSNQCTVDANPQNEVCLSRLDQDNETISPVLKTIRLSGIKNPSVKGAYYVRLSVYGNTAFNQIGRVGDGVLGHVLGVSTLASTGLNQVAPVLAGVLLVIAGGVVIRRRYQIS